MNLESYFDGLADKAEQAAKESNRKEHLGADGLLYCDTCGKPTQTRVEVFGKERTVRCICKCDQDRLKAEKEARKEERRRLHIERLRVNGFDKAEMQMWTFEHDDGQQPKVTRAAKAYCERFDDFKASGKGLLFFGDVGTGKTYAAACIANELLNRGVPVLMTNFARIINRLQDKFEGRQEYLDSLNAFDLLIIDDLAAERNTEYVNEAVYNVIDARYRTGLPLIVTSNISPDRMMTEENVSRQRIYSRVTELCHPVEVRGTDRRVKSALDNFAEMNRLLGL